MNGVLRAGGRGARLVDRGESSSAREDRDEHERCEKESQQQDAGEYSTEFAEDTVVVRVDALLDAIQVAQSKRCGAEAQQPQDSIADVGVIQPPVVGFPEKTEHDDDRDDQQSKYNQLGSESAWRLVDQESRSHVDGRR